MLLHIPDFGQAMRMEKPRAKMSGRIPDVEGGCTWSKFGGGLHMVGIPDEGGVRAKVRETEIVSVSLT